mmetsp:Transcript_13642/g.18068  ORF Transcript_13642/g.18068 Transcript_13642/m.18068 type:complete len:282 (+) Transcript_13642:988-1833(+)
MDTKFEVLGESFVELLVLLFIFSKFIEKLNRFLHEVLLDHPQDLILLKSLTRNVERKVFRVDNALDKRKVFWHKILAVVHDEDTSYIELDRVALLLVTTLEHVKWCAPRHEKKRSELKLALDREMLHSSMVLPVIGQAFVERTVLFWSHVISLAHPYRLLAVQVIPVVCDLLDLFRLLWLFGFVIIFFGDILDLRSIIFLAFFLIIFFLFVIRYFLLFGLLDVEFDRETNKLGVLLHQVLQTPFLKILFHVFFQSQFNASSSANRKFCFLSILRDCESTTC